MSDSAARQYFDFLMGQPDKYGYLASLPAAAEPVLEMEWLEFKACPPEDKQIKRIWSETVSAFANTAGGVLVWGIRAARVRGQTIDCVIAVEEVQDPQGLRQKLKGWHLHATDPPAPGIEMECIQHPAEPRGFLVCYIPEGNPKPCRAEFSERNYWIRSQDNNVIPNPSLLRSLFFPQPRRELQLEISSRRAEPNTSVDMVLRNIGYVSATNMTIKVGSNVATRHRNVNQMLASSGDVGRVHVNKLDADLHPGQSRPLGRVTSEERQFRLSVMIYQTDCQPLGVWVDIDPIRAPNGKVKLSSVDAEFEML